MGYQQIHNENISASAKCKQNGVCVCVSKKQYACIKLLHKLEGKDMIKKQREEKYLHRSIILRTLTHFHTASLIRHEDILSKQILKSRCAIQVCCFFKYHVL